MLRCSRGLQPSCLRHRALALLSATRPQGSVHSKQHPLTSSSSVVRPSATSRSCTIWYRDLASSSSRRASSAWCCRRKQAVGHTVASVILQLRAGVRGAARAGGGREQAAAASKAGRHSVCCSHVQQRLTSSPALFARSACSSASSACTRALASARSRAASSFSRCGWDRRGGRR